MTLFIPHVSLSSPPPSAKGRRAGKTGEELVVELEEEAKRDAAKQVRVVLTQMPRHLSGRLVERLGAKGRGCWISSKVSSRF